MEQPNFDELSTALTTAGREMGRLPNLPVIDQGAQILAQIQQISNSLTQVNATLTQVQQEVAQVRTDLGQVQTELGRVQTDMHAGFGRLTTRMDARYVV
jgi:septal ring factor EnvC (AmiA/AmiB activator)